MMSAGENALTSVGKGCAPLKQDRVWKPHRALSFDNFSGAFHVLALGLSIAAIVLTTEIAYEYLKASGQRFFYFLLNEFKLIDIVRGRI